MISVCIPVGPYAWYKHFLGECLESVAAQTLPPNDVILIDDMANIEVADLAPLLQPTDEVVQDEAAKFALRVVREGRDVVRVWQAPWRLGIPGCANMGVALGQTDLVFQLSCDDWLEPTCLESCAAAWERNNRQDGYYWVVAHYFGDQEGYFTTPCSFAMVTKGFWQRTGGFPVEAVLAGDFMFMQVCGQYDFTDGIVPVADEPLYHMRIHPDTATHQSMVQRTLAKERAIEHSGNLAPGLVKMLEEYCVLSWRTPEDWGRRS